MSFTSIPDRHVKHAIFNDVFGSRNVGERSWALLKGDMAWDGTVLPEYAEEWWMNKSPEDGNTYVKRAADWVIGNLRRVGLKVDIDGQYATIHAGEYGICHLSDADRLLIKRHCLGKIGVIYRLKQVCDAGSAGHGIPIFRVDFLGVAENVSGWGEYGLWRDMYVPGRLDVCRVYPRLSAWIGMSRVCKREDTTCERLNVIPRPTILKAVNKAKIIAKHMPAFDAVLAKDAARKRERLASAPWASGSVDDDDLVGIE